MHVTEWLLWFFDALNSAVELAHLGLDAVLTRARFWRQWAEAPMNERQVKLLNRLLDGFDGKLTTSKWDTIAKCSPGYGAAGHHRSGGARRPAQNGGRR